MTIGLLITCEHASNKIPAKYASYFKDHQALLQTHLGWDIGALDCYTALCKALPCTSQKGNWSRLLIELNRSLGHPHLFSSITKTLDKSLQNQIIEQYYTPYRAQIIRKIECLLVQHTKVLHIGVHSFTPTLKNIERNADIGLLYDPKRKGERDFCYQLKHLINEKYPKLKVRMNYPYQGTSDGLTTSLRKQFSAKTYLGAELEINQKHLIHTKNKVRMINIISETMQKLLK